MTRRCLRCGLAAFVLALLAAVPGVGEESCLGCPCELEIADRIFVDTVTIESCDSITVGPGGGGEGSRALDTPGR